MKTKGKQASMLALIIVWIFVISVCSESQEETKVEGTLFAMNTYMTFTAYGSKAQEGLDSAQDQVKKLESLLSVTEVNSDIYRANHSDGQAVEISEETAELISFAIKMAEETNGVLDLTIYPVLTAWGFTTEQKQVPAPEQIEQLLPYVDYSQISLEENLLTVPKGIQLDLGAVGKGYTADLMEEIMRKYGVESAIFSLGGNIHAIGSKPDGTPWRIGIKAPWENENLGVLEISNAAVVTSGGYENYFEDDEGNVYWHILNPETGYPAESGLLSVTIVGSEGRLCDALSTALFVMGAKQAEDYWRTHSGFEMLYITQNHEIFITEGLCQQFILDNSRTENVQVIRPYRELRN